MKKIIAIALALLMILSFAGCGKSKTVTVEVTHSDGTVNTIEIKTKEETLRGALEQEDLIAGEESEYGLWIKTIDGETTDDAQEQWWGYTKNGEYVDTLVDETIIEDGDHYEFTFNVGYDM